ncbi:MAG: CPBP family glutamic-type intramembrane protease [Cyanobacteriota bacterium]|nr:CPBP family glutamic-type intramembrane protease [Cyanobacteriota bacterium]
MSLRPSRHGPRSGCRGARARLLVLAVAGLAAWPCAPPVLAPARAVAPGTPSQPRPGSSEALARRSPWSRPDSYPLTRRPPANLYRPSADWLGRLVLPTRAEVAAPEAPRDDWVWIVLEQAPAAHQELVGQRRRLRWAALPHLQGLVAAVTTTIRLGETARRAAADGNVVPTRLNGRRVGPLQSLAGSRPGDDLTVRLDGVSVEADALRITQPPTQISGRWQALATVLGPAGGDGLYRVRHFRADVRQPVAVDRNHADGLANSKGFVGPVETIRMPSLPPDRYGRRLLDPTGLARSPLNRDGWLIQGAPAGDGVFTAQAVIPYAVLRLTPDRLVRGTDGALAFVHRQNWSANQLRRGSQHHTALLPDREPSMRWRVGDRALLMHLFGGIGGADGEPVQIWTVTGHFSFGEARVVRDGFTGEPRLAIRYHQIYANNPNGIVAGSQDWSAYAGSLQRGWVGLRPFSDGLVPMGGEVLEAVALQAEILAARYRSGDGGGVALVTPSTSCVQDSSQALWIAIGQLRAADAGNGMSDVDRERLRELGVALDRLLKPFGRVRSDWAHNADQLLPAGTRPPNAPPAGGDLFETNQTLKVALLSWRSILPRAAHDQFAAEFLRAGLPLLVLRTNQIPGANPRLEPVAPTVLFGQLPVIPTLLGRLGDSLFPLWSGAGLAWGLTLGIGAAALTLTGGWRRGLLLLPALAEEVAFRGLLLPSALEGVGALAMVPWIGLSVGVFVAWHAVRIGHRRGGRWIQLVEPRVLVRWSLLGGACALATVSSGSLWPAVLLHWLALVAWRERRRPLKPQSMN